MTIAALTFDIDGPTPLLAMGNQYAGHTGLMSQTQYGTNRGLKNVLRVLDETDTKATFFMPGLMAEWHPGLAADLIARGHEVGHHTHTHRPPVTMSDDEQRIDFTRAMDVFERQGIPIAGYRAANWQTNEYTLKLIEEHGLYDSSLSADDRPYRTDRPGGGFIELPVRWALDDWEQYAYAPEPNIGSLLRPPRDVLSLWRDAHDSAAGFGAMFLLTLHPELVGHAERVTTLRDLIVHARSHGTDFARCTDIAANAAADPDLPTYPTTPPPTSAYPR